MKKIALSICATCLLYALNAQENSFFVDSILHLVMTSQIPIYNARFQRLENHKMVFAKVDTSISDMWTRPKYVNNVYQACFDGTAGTIPFVFDTVSNKTNNGFVNFVIAERDNTGNYLKDTVWFLIDKSAITKTAAGGIPWELITSRHSFWQNEEIRIAGQTIELDSCHLLYRLEFNQDFTYKQYYYHNKSQCYTESMQHQINLDVQEGSPGRFFSYYNKIQGHYIDNSTGRWQVNNNMLFMENRNNMRYDAYKIVKLSADELILEVEANNYQIKFRKTYW